MEELFGGIVINHKNEKIDIKNRFAGKTVGIYFCRLSDDGEELLSVFAEYYKNNHETKNFEIVFISFEDIKSEFESYYSKMPWLTMPFNKKELAVSRCFILPKVKENNFHNIYSKDENIYKVLSLPWFSIFKWRYW
jgi:hypothetical protein